MRDRKVDSDGPLTCTQNGRCLETQQEGSLELDVYIADHVVCQVVADVQMLNLSKLVHLLKDVLIEVLPDSCSSLSMMMQFLNSKADKRASCSPEGPSQEFESDIIHWEHTLETG